MTRLGPLAVPVLLALRRLRARRLAGMIVALATAGAQEVAHDGGTTVVAASHDPDLVSAADGRLQL